VHLAWTPQRKVWIALGVSALALLVCLGLALVPSRRPWRPVGDAQGDGFSSLPGLPTFASPFHPSGRPLTRQTRLLTALVGTALGILLIGPVAGSAVGLALAVVLGQPRWRALLTAGSVALLASASMYVLELQWRYRFPAKIEWPERFHRMTLVPWVAAAFLIGDAVIEHLRARRESST
jgi:hypothetical protein